MHHKKAKLFVILLTNFIYFSGHNDKFVGMKPKTVTMIENF